jgi:thiol-disulfide isomerase/thioredoxin
MLLVTHQAAPVEPRAAPTLVLKDLRGRAVRLSDYRGRVVLLNFWATWCAPCRAEAPDLVRVQREYGARGLQVVGITYPPESRAAVRRFVRSFQINYPVWTGTRATKALFFAGETLPVTVVIDREGRVRELIEGILLPEEFEEKIKPLLERADENRRSAKSEPARHESSFATRRVLSQAKKE